MLIVIYDPSASLNFVGVQWARLPFLTLPAICANRVFRLPFIRDRIYECALCAIQVVESAFITTTLFSFH